MRILATGLMRLFAGFALLLSFAALPMDAAIVRLHEQTLPLLKSELVRVRAEVASGNIEVVTGESAEIKVALRASYDVESEAEVDRLHSGMRVIVQRSGPSIDVGLEYSRDARWAFDNWPPVKITLLITVPQHTDLDLSSRDGTLTVARMEGNMKAHTRAGVIYFKGVRGNVEADSEFSDIIVAHCSGDIKLRCGSSEFRVGPVGGNIDVLGHGGEIIAGPTCRQVKAETSGADLVVTFRHPVVATASLRTGGGNVILTLDRRSSVTLDLRASLFGKVAYVKDSLPLTVTSGALGRSRVQATVNGGGPLIEARAGGGSISFMGESTVE